jgi:hypothetical protein
VHAAVLARQPREPRAHVTARQESLHCARHAPGHRPAGLLGRRAQRWVLLPHDPPHEVVPEAASLDEDRHAPRAEHGVCQIPDSLERRLSPHLGVEPSAEPSVTRRTFVACPTAERVGGTGPTETSSGSARGTRAGQGQHGSLASGLRRDPSATP